MENFTRFLDAINRGLDILVPAIGLIILLIILLVYAYRRIRRSGFGSGLFLAAILGLEELFLVGAIWFLPEWLSRAFGGKLSIEFFTWVILYLIFSLWYLWTRKNAGLRGLFAALTVLTLILFGWLYNYWIGVIFITLPLLAIFLILIYHLAQVVLPSAEPDRSEERWNKFKMLLAYLVGIQYPFWVVKDSAGYDIEMRIPGNNGRQLGGPGLVWMRPHQLVGLSSGVEFSIVNGQGALFTRRFERPIATVDLRTQLRRSEIKTVTRDGVPVTVFVSASFAIDREDTPSNPPLDRHIGSFSYSTERVKATLGTVGVRSGAQEENTTIQWDEWVVKQVEHAARLVVSERDLNELWRPRNDDRGVSAATEMADQLKATLAERLLHHGVRLYSARIADFKPEDKDNVTQKKIEAWQSIWSEKVKATREDAEARYNEEIESARAYAKSILLDSIADSIKQAADDEKNPDLPRHVIAMYFIHALEEYVRERPTDEEARKRLQTMKEFLLYNRTEE